jgi:murein DD-endopeptidase MepM/ murein hydrolase activator NlpD
VRPASGYISSWFGNRGTICGNGCCTTGHRGIDFATAAGRRSTPRIGRVVFAAYTDAWGNYVKVDHGGGIVTGYAHIVERRLQRQLRPVGQRGRRHRLRRQHRGSPAATSTSRSTGRACGPGARAYAPRHLV